MHDYVAYVLVRGGGHESLYGFRSRRGAADFAMWNRADGWVDVHVFMHVMDGDGSVGVREGTYGERWQTPPAPGGV